MGSGAATLAIVAAASCLHGATFTSFRGGGKISVGEAFRTTLHHLLPLSLMCWPPSRIYAFLAWWAGYSVTPAARLASWLTLRLVRPATVMRYFNAVLWIVRWVLLPADLLPLFSGVAARGWRGFNEFGWRRYSRLYRLEVPLLTLCALWLPFRLLDWVPRVNGFTMEMLGFTPRTAVAYLLFVSAAMVLAFLTSRGKPASADRVG